MRIPHRARALILGAASALLLFGSGCVVHEYRPDTATYAQQQQPTQYYAYYGGHVIPERYGGGWCFIQGLHYHVYPPDYAEYYQNDDGYYSYQGPVSFYFYGPHPIPAADGGGWCYRHGRHVHHYHPGYNLGWHYQPTYRYYYWDPNRRDADNGRYHPAEPAYRRAHPVYVTPGHPVRGGGTYAGHPARPASGTPAYGHPVNGGTAPGLRASGQRRERQPGLRAPGQRRERQPHLRAPGQRWERRLPPGGIRGSATATRCPGAAGASTSGPSRARASPRAATR